MNFAITGLRFYLNMKPLNPNDMSQNFKPYTLNIQDDGNIFDQKRALIDLIPGYHFSIKVSPQVKDISQALEKEDIRIRGCKLSSEIEGFKFLNKYSKSGCEFECAIQKSLNICQCLPWFYGIESTDSKTCNWFGSKCFEDIMVNEEYYKNCSDTCLPDCKATTLTVISSVSPINKDEFCNKKVLEDLRMNKQNHWFKFGLLDFLTGKTDDRPWHMFLDDQSDVRLRQACEEFARNYVAYITIEALNSEVIQSIKEMRVTFTDQLGMVGGTLGLFTGMSVLSFLEIGWLLVGLVRTFFLRMNKVA